MEGRKISGLVIDYKDENEEQQEDHTKINSDFDYSAITGSRDKNTESQPSDLSTQSAISEEFEKFFKSFKSQENKYYYTDKITELVQKEDKTVLVRHIDLPDNLQDCIFKDSRVESNLEAMQDAVQDVYKQNFPDVDDKELNRIRARLTIDDKHLLTKLKNINIDLNQALVVFNCLVTSQTENKPALRRKIYVCGNCGISYDYKRIMCSSDICLKEHKGAKSVKFSIKASKFVDSQQLEVQERQDDTDTQSIPKQLTVKVYGDLVNKFKAGDNVQIVGFVKLGKTVSDSQIEKMEVNDEFSSDLIFDLVVEAHNIQLISATKNTVIDDPTKILQPKDIKLILDTRAKLSDAELLKKLRSCFAYWVYGNDEVKDILLLQCVGSNPVKLGKHASKRGEINVLIVGDPGVVKTVLLNAVINLSTKGVYTSGKGSSGVGLTASIDTTAKGINKLKIGAVVLADGSICACDEFLEISPDSQAHLLECMENGTIHMNKNGINVVLNARTSILGACNPDNGKYNPHATLMENVTLSPQIWSRWDIVTVIRDKPDPKKDGKVADHILSLYEPDSNYNRPDDDDFLYKWMIYARSHNTKGVRITDEAKVLIKSFYGELRIPEHENDVTATPRQLEAIIRFCFASARLLLKDVVDDEVVKLVIFLMTHHYNTTGLLNTKSGGLNQTAQYSKALNKLSPKIAFLEAMKVLTNNNEKSIEKLDVIVELMRKGDWKLTDATDYTDEMIEKGIVLEVRQGWIKLPG